MGLFLLIAALMAFIWWLKRPAARSGKQMPMRAPLRPAPAPPTTATPVNVEEEIAKLRGMGTRARAVGTRSANISTVDATRHELQRMAYLVQRDRPDLAAEFTGLMNNFMDIDPQYEQGLAVALPLIAAQPGIRQTALYQPMRMDAEDCRRVLYFAESKGRIVRVKKGNSYQLYLPSAAPR